MSAQPRRVTNSEVWMRWEGSVVKGIYPLRRFLGGSDQGAVFLSKYDTGKVTDVAIKIVPAVGSQAEARLAHWRTAAALTHPNLVRLFDMGRCQLGGREYLFSVMEYGEQTLAEFIAQRTLTADEVRALLLPTLEVLAFLHGNQLLHAQLKPSNFLVVNDQLKLSSDTVRPVGHRGLSTADDIFSLGMTLIEAFTQRTPSTPEEQDELGSLLTNVPATYANTVRRCLHPNAANRPTVPELQAQCESARPSEEPADDRPHANPLLLTIPAVILFALAGWIALHPSTSPQMEEQRPAASAPKPAPAPSPVAKSTRPAPAPAAEPTPSEPVAVSPPAFRLPPTSSPAVVVEVIPEIPRSLREKVLDPVPVTVRVLVDAAGDVMAVLMERPSSNRGLNNLADEAARGWKFLPAEREGTRVWILTFEFTRYGTTARANAV